MASDDWQDVATGVQFWIGVASLGDVEITLGVTTMRLLSLCLLATCVSASAQSFSYELFEVGGDARVLIAKDTVSFGPDRMPRASQEGENSKSVERDLPLASGFAIGCSDYGAKEPTGFGCWLKRSRSRVSLDRYEGFSWEWYDHGIGSLYLKRQGGTKVGLKTLPIQGTYAMESLEFLEDTVFKMNANPTSKPGSYTHELLIRGGSTLLLASPPVTQ